MTTLEATSFVHPGAHRVSETWGSLHRDAVTHPFVMVFPKQRYALVVFDMWRSGHVMTFTGYMTVIECFRRHSVGAKGWAASGGRRVVRCARVPLMQAELCASELVDMLKDGRIEIEAHPLTGALGGDRRQGRADNCR
jgi:hypothetical protein